MLLFIYGWKNSMKRKDDLKVRLDKHSSRRASLEYRTRTGQELNLISAFLAKSGFLAPAFKVHYHTIIFQRYF